MNRIRIMHVVDSLGTGGTEEGIRKVLSGLDKAVFEQTVCTVAPCNYSETAGGARVVSVLKRQGRRQMLIGPFKRIFELERPHIVHSRNWGAIEAIVAARLGGVQGVVHSEHGLESSTYRGQPLRRNAIRRFSFAWTDRVFAVSRALRTYYVQQLRIAEERIGVIPNGVDTDRFRPRRDSHLAVTEGWRASSSTIVIGTVGRLDPVKDHHTLLKAIDLLFAMNIDVHLLIVGDGPEREALQARVRNRSPRAAKVTFVGETRKVASYLNSFDIFVLPSLAEGMSNALLEAMSSGIACVASRVGGNSELIEEGLSGLLFDAGDAKALADRLKVLALNPQYRQNLGENARKRVENSFSLHRMMHNYTRLYTDLVANKYSNVDISNNRIRTQPEME
jgi:sugar transferase (PEP-CTERM/EpsH1 system associated)